LRYAIRIKIGSDEGWPYSIPVVTERGVSDTSRPQVLLFDTRGEAEVYAQDHEFSDYEIEPHDL
jgi:hypothetical protein